MNVTERRAYDQLKRLYTHVQGPLPRTKWGAKDLWNRWDFCCVSDEQIAFIQVSSVALYNRGREYKARLQDFATPPGSIKEYWWEKQDPKDKRKKYFKVLRIPQLIMRAEFPIKKSTREGGSKIIILVPENSDANEIGKAIRFLKYVKSLITKQ